MLTEPLSPVPESVPASVPESVPVSPPPGVVPPPPGVVLPPTWSGISSRTIIGWVLGAAALYGIHTLDGGVEVRGLQLASGSGSQAETFDVLRYRPIFLLVGASLYLQA